MNKTLQAGLGLCISFICYGPVAIQAMTFEPFYQNNQHPFVQPFNLPEAESAYLLRSGQYQSRYQLAITNNALQQTDGTESIVLDGEIYRLTWAGRTALSNGLEIGFAVPFIWYDKGFLDQTIGDWHKWFGLSERPLSSTKNQLQYRYVRNSQTVILLDSATDGIGDIRLQVALPVVQSPQRAWRLQGGIKLPTGDVGSLRGSGSTDVSLTVAVSDSDFVAGWPVNVTAGVVRIGDAEFLPQQVRRMIYYASLATAYPLTPRWQLKAQLDVHTSLFDSALESLGGNALQLNVGATWQWRQQVQLDLGMTQNLVTDVTPDVVFFFALRQYH